MEQVSQYVNGMISIICLSIGFLIKNSLPNIPNRLIPLISGVLGIFFNIWLNNWNVSPEIIVCGLISGLSSCGTFDLMKNTMGLKL